MEASYEERVFVNGTGKSCDWCNGVKTGYRRDKSAQFLLRFAEHPGLFCSPKCMRLHKDAHGKPA